MAACAAASSPLLAAASATVCSFWSAFLVALSALDP